MNQSTYLSTLKRALAGIPAAEVRDILSDCERHFIDGVAAGRDEASIAQGLGDPRRMAAELRAAIGVAAYEKKSSFANLLRLMSVLTGLASFNLLMLIPALVLPILLLSSYLVSGSAVMAGTFMTVSGVTGIDRVASVPGQGLVMHSGGDAIGPGTAGENFRIEVSNFGMKIGAPAEGRIDIDVGSASENATEFSRWRIVYGVLYFLLGLVLWRVSGKMARALMLGFAKYLRLNRSIIVDAATTTA